MFFAFHKSFVVFSHAFIEPRCSRHLPPRRRTESVNTYTVVFIDFPTGSLSSDKFSNRCHTVQVPNAYQIVQLCLHRFDDGLGLAYLEIFQDIIADVQHWRHTLFMKMPQTA